MKHQAKAAPTGSSHSSGAARGRSLRCLGISIVAVGLFLAASAQALAVPDTYFKVGEFGQHQDGSADGQFKLPMRAAVDDSTDHILVVDSGNNRVQVFAPGGNSATFLTAFGAGALSNPFGIAVDQSNGDVYVSNAGSNSIVKFESNGAATPTYTVDPSFDSPTAGPDGEAGEIGNFAVPLAVDPSNGDLVVGDPGNHFVDRYEADGTFVGSFNGSTSPSGAFATLTDVAVKDSGDVVVARATHVDQFSATGAHQLDLGAIPQSFAQGTILAIDPNTGYTLVGSGYGGYTDPETTTAIRAFNGATLVSSVVLGADGTNGVWAITGLAVDGGSGSGAGHVYAVASRYQECCGFNSVTVLAAGTAPSVSMEPPSAPTATGVHLGGTVTPNGTDTHWHFEFSIDGEHWSRVPFPDGDAGSGTSPVAIATDPDNLRPNTTYRVRLVVENEAARRTTPQQTFTTEQAVPTVRAQTAAPVLETSARLSARINPNGLATSYYFEYGADDTYGTFVPASQDGSVGEGSSDVLVSAELEGLQPGATYHFRVVASNDIGPSEGPDTTFTTKTAAELALPQRGVELVNQPDKGQQNPAGSFLSPTRDRVLWGVFGGAPGSTSGAGASFLADRGEAGWKSKNVLPAASEQAGQGFNHYDVSSYTPDLSKFVIIATQGILTASDSQILTLDDEGHQKLLWSFPPGEGAMSYDSSDDLSHVVGLVNEPIDPRHVAGTANVYDFGSGDPELVDVMPDGSVPSCGVPNGSNFAGFGSNPYSPYRWISASDASQVFFQTSGEECVGPLEIYVRHRDAGTTTWISGPPTAGPDRGAWFIRGNEEGDEAMFVTATRLDPLDSNETADIYRYRRGTAVSCITCTVSNADVSFDTQLDRRIIVSDDMSHVYFQSFNVLVPGMGKQGEPNLYVWHNGQIDYVSPSSLFSLFGGTYGVTPDGNVLFFHSSAKGITSDDNGGFEQYYRYDDRTGGLECVSCAPDGSPSTAPAIESPSFHGATAMTADGNTFVFKTKAALVPQDVNGTDDIYEWHNGAVGLVSDGETVWREGPGQLSLLGISANGQNVLFMVGARLTGYETDQVAQVYVARIGGGFGSPPAPRPPCSEDACQGSLQAAPATQSPSSDIYTGPGNEKAEARKCPKGTSRQGKKCVKKHGKQKKKHHKRRGHAQQRTSHAKTGSGK